MKRRRTGAMVLVLVLGFILFLSTHLFASEIEHLWDEGRDLYYAGRLKEAAAKWEVALELARKAGDKGYAGWFLTWIGAVYSGLGQYEKSMEYCEQALAIHRETGDRRNEARDLNILAVGYSKTQRHEKALECCEQALAIHRLAGDKGGEGGDLNILGTVYSELGRYEKALECYEQALAIHRETGDISQGPDLANIGITYKSLRQFEKALEYCEQALRIIRGIGDRHAEEELLDNIGLVYSDLGQHRKALEYHEQALAIKRERGDRVGEVKALGNIGMLYGNLGQYAKAREYFEQALKIDREIGDRAGEAHSLHNLGVAHHDSGQYVKALEYYEQAFKINREMGDRGGEAKRLSSIGALYLELGRYENALEHSEQALAIMRDIGDRSGEAETLGNIVMVYLFLGQYGKALEYCDQARAFPAGDRRTDASVLSSAGLAYAYLHRHTDALESYERVLAIYREIGDRGGEARTLHNIGGVYADSGQYQKALQYYEQALPITREIGDRSDEGNALTNIGVVYNFLGQYRKAREALEAGLVICNETGVQEALWITHRSLGEADAGLEDYKEAISHYGVAIDTIESMRAGLTAKEAKTSFMERKLFIYDVFIKLLQTLHEKDPSQGYDKKALEIFERKQGRTFLEEIGKSAAKNFSGLPDEVRAKEAALSDEGEKMLSALVEERSKPAQSRNSERIQGLEERLRRIKAGQEALRKEIKAGYPDYYALKYPTPATLSELQQSVLEPGELMLVYNVMKESTCLWIIGEGEFRFFTIPAGEKGIEEKVAESTNAALAIPKAVGRIESESALQRIAQRSQKAFEQAGRNLYDLLVPEGARETVAKAGTLYIIPTGALYTLPFETLFVFENPGVQGPHYLVQDHPIAYLSSASLLKTLREAGARKKEKAQYPLLAFANPVYKSIQNSSPPSPQPSDKTPAAGDGRSSISSMRGQAYLHIMGGSFPELPDTEEEAREIKAIFEAPDNSRPLQLREAASRSNVLSLNEEEKLKDYRFLLFSCHGIAPDEVDPLMQPALVLSLPDPKTGKEEYLTMADAFGLKLNAELVTLSACNTGRGKVQKGEGVMGLTRAFMYAGTPAITVTLWSVESGSAKTLSTGLFRELKEGKGRAEALRDVKLSMLGGEKGDLYRHPFFWAPVVLFGDGK